MPMSTKIVIKPVPHRKRTWTNQLEYLKKTVMPALKKCDYSVLFWMKVNTKDFPTYPSIVKCPMDFSVIESRLKEYYYESAKECISDINTVFANCCIFSQAGEDITLISEHLLREKYLKKMQDFPPEEVPFERKKRGPGRKRAALSPAGVSLDSDGHVSTRRHSMESIESQSNPAFVADGIEASPSGNGETKGRGALISRIVKDQGPVPTLKVSNVPARREREARPQASMSLTNISGITSMTDTKPRIKLSPSLSRCQKLINDLIQYRRRKFNWPFLEPVDPVSLNLPDYFQIVKNPMDLSTIKSNLENGVYIHKNQVKEHIDLMLANCYLYNGHDSLVADCGRQLGAFFEKKFAAIPDDIEHPANSKRHKHKHHKVGKRHKRDRADEEFFRFSNLSPEGAPQFLPEDVEKINVVLNRMLEVVERMASRCGDYDRLSRVILNYREKLNDDTLPAPTSAEPIIRQLQSELNCMCTLNGVVTPTAGLSNGTVGGTAPSSGRSAGRPRKRPLPAEAVDVDVGNSKTPSSNASMTSRGKRKRVDKVQPDSLDESTLNLPGGQEVPSGLAIDEALPRKINDKAAAAASALALHAASVTTLLKEEAMPEPMDQVQPTTVAYNEGVEDKLERGGAMDDHELTYEEKAELSQELQRVSDTNLLNELGAIVQRFEPQVQSASSGELNVDLTVLNNTTLLALKRAMDRAKPSGGDTVGDLLQIAPTDMSTGGNANSTAGGGNVPDLKPDSDEEMEEEDEEEEEDDLDTTAETLAMMTKDERSLLTTDGESASPATIAQRDDSVDEVRGAGDISQLSSSEAEPAERPRGRRNRKAVNPVRNRGAATVLGAPAAASSSTSKDEPAGDTEAVPGGLPAAAVTSALSSVSSAPTSAPADDSEDTPLSSPDKSSSSAADIVQASSSNNPATNKDSSILVPPAAVGKKGHYGAPHVNFPAIKLPPNLKKNSSKSDNQSKAAPKMETSTPVRRRSSSVAQSSDETDYISNKSDSDEDHEKESPVKSDDEFRGPPLVSQQNPRRIFDIWSEDTSSKSETKRRNAKTNDDRSLKDLEDAYKAVIIQSKQELISKEFQRDLATIERREEEERRKRDEEERKRREEQAKEARKEALKEQERKRLNEIRARNRRADMPLRQYADMANFEKKLDFSLLSPRWFS